VFKRGPKPGPTSRTAAAGGTGAVAGLRAGTQAGAQADERAATGAAAEDRALRLLQRAGLVLVERNYRVARGPAARGGEIDLVMREPDGTLVFVEVRARAGTDRGGAAASITPAKRRALVYAAQCFLLRLPAPPPCRFDVVAIDGDDMAWLKAAFDAG
jgi:putative endonuclease